MLGINIKTHFLNADNIIILLGINAYGGLLETCKSCIWPYYCYCSTMVTKITLYTTVVYFSGYNNMYYAAATYYI